MSDSIGPEIVTLVVSVVVLAVIVALLTWVFQSRSSGQANDAERYIARLNAAAAQQQMVDTEKAEKLRAATTARAAKAASTSPGRMGQSTGVGHPGAGPAPGQSNPDYEQVVQLVRSGDAIGAIRKVRRDTGLGLLEAKRYVDSLAGR